MTGPNFWQIGMMVFGRSGQGRYLLLCLLVGAAASVGSIDAQTVPTPLPPEDPKWFFSMSLGEGQLKLESDQQTWKRVPTFAIGIDLGRRIGPWARAGMEANGWLLEAFNLNNPAVGESVGHVMAIGDALPLRNHALFVRGGFGRSSYTNSRPNGSNGGGLAWMVGGGYEIPVSRSVRLVPAIGYSVGHLGKGATPAPLMHLRYSVIEFKLAALYRFGS